MKNSRLLRRTLLFSAAWLLAVAASAQTTATQKPTFEPQSGQPGKDVVWVPTPQALVEKMLDIAKVTAKDFVMDLGSGDGRTVITAAKRGATAVGIEYEPEMVALSKQKAVEAGVDGKATFMKADLFETDLSKATVITMFLLPQINMKLRPKLLELKPGTRIVSNTFTMEDWQPDDTAEVTEDCTSWCKALLWIVPAKVDGTWKTPQGELKLTQTFQTVSGTLGVAQIAEGRLRGSVITFTANGRLYEGQVTGSSIKGTAHPVNGGADAAWTATRLQ